MMLLSLFVDDKQRCLGIAPLMNNETQTMKPFPYTEVSAIEREMCDMRDEVSRLRVQLQNAQSCLNALQQKRTDLITEAREGDLFEQMFGDDDGRGQDSAFMDQAFGG